jgi:hypothetical protein
MPRAFHISDIVLMTEAEKQQGKSSNLVRPVNNDVTFKAALARIKPKQKISTTHLGNPSAL